MSGYAMLHITACSVILYPNLADHRACTTCNDFHRNIALNCFGDNTGTGTFYASGGTMPYTFTVVTNTAGATISFPGFNSQTFFGAGAGTVTVSVTDQKGCSAQGTIVITQPALLTPGTIAANQVICSGTNPAQLTETVPASGGPAPFVYQWQYGSTAARTIHKYCRGKCKSVHSCSCSYHHSLLQANGNIRNVCTCLQQCDRDKGQSKSSGNSFRR